MQTEHPFAQYVRILGKGKNGSRALTPYAGKRRQLPWFILSTLLLAQNGVKIFMHGARHRSLHLAE